SKVTSAPLARAGSGALNSGSTRTLPVKHSAGPLAEGCEPFRLISIADFPFRFDAVSVRCSGSGFARHDLDGRRAGAGADHRAEVGVAVVFLPVRLVYSSLIGPSTGSKHTSFVMP